MGELIGDLSRWAVETIYSFGYAGVFVLIALQNLFPPIPSALILSLAGFLVGQGRFAFVLVLLAATAGSVASALVLYVPGRLLGEERLRSFVGRFGRFVFLDESDLDKASGWFDKHHGKAVLIGRLVPGIGTLISVPAGIERMPIWKFLVYTALGTALWNGAFIGLGWALGAQWRHVRQYAHVVEYVVLAAVVGGLIWFLWRWWKAHQ